MGCDYDSYPIFYYLCAYEVSGKISKNVWIFEIKF